MKRILLALAVGVAMFATVAYAAWLIVDGGGLQSGWDYVECDPDGVSVFYINTDSDTTYEGADVRDVECSGTKDVTVLIEDGSNIQLAIGTTTSSAMGTIFVPFTDELGSPGEVAAAHHVYVTIVTVAP
jgi:hypothetical protein